MKFNVLEQGIERAIAKVKTLFGRSGVRDVIGKQIGAAPLTNIDEALGNFNKKDIARETFDYLASEYSKYEVALGKIDNILSEAEALLTQGKRGRFSKRLLNHNHHYHHHRHQKSLFHLLKLHVTRLNLSDH